MSRLGRLLNVRAVTQILAEPYQPDYFKTVLPGAQKDGDLATTPTVNQTQGGAPAGSQLVDLGFPSRAQADALLAPYVCDTSQGPPG